jgi:hypothetical protein
MLAVKALKLLSVICDDVVVNSSLKPSLLQWTLQTRHPTQINKSDDFSKRKMT